MHRAGDILAKTGRRQGLVVVERGQEQLLVGGIGLEHRDRLRALACSGGHRYLADLANLISGGRSITTDPEGAVAGTSAGAVPILDDGGWVIVVLVEDDGDEDVVGEVVVLAPPPQPASHATLTITTATAAIWPAPPARTA